MNETTTAAVAVSGSVSEYHIGHTTYRVTTTFNPAFRQSLSDILARLITEDCEKMLGESGQEQEYRRIDFFSLVRYNDNSLLYPVGK